MLDGLRTMSLERRATIAFMVSGETILIEGIFYGGQDFETMLRGEDKEDGADTVASV